MKLFVNTFLIALLLLPASFAADSKHACGAVSLYHLATILGIEVSLDKTDTALKEKQEGSRTASFAELITCAKAFGIELQGVKLTYAQLQTFNTPVIAHLKTTFVDENPSAADGTIGHFVVVEHTTEKWVRLFDIPKPLLHDAAIVISKDRFLELWTGRVLTLSKKQQHQRQPILIATPTLYDFGEGKLGKYKIPVQLKNRSGTPLKIIGIRTDCSCTVVEKSGNIIPMGGTTALDLNWDARALNRSLFTSIHIQTDSAERPHTFVSLGLIREFSVIFVPETLYLPRSSASNITQRTVSLQNRGEKAVKIQKIETSQEWLHPILQSSKVVHPWRAADIKIKFEIDQMPEGEFAETLILHYVKSSSEIKTITLPISGQVNQRYILTPNRFFFGRIKTTEENTKAVVLKNLSETDIEIEKLEADVGTIQVKKCANENCYQVQLTLPPRLPTGIFKDEVRIHTTHPKMRLIKVPVFAIIAK